MEYVATETSNQFVQAGFGEGTYGPETLGIIFKPAKWREKQKGLPGSTYHYAVPTNIYQRMMAAKDIDAYFNNTIKAHPEQYPFMKVETENPTYAAGASATPQANQTASAQSAGKIEMTTDNPVTSLAVIDTLENSALFASGGVTDAQLAAGREWYLANAPKGIETEEKRTALKRFARPLQKLRTGIEARAKEFTGETKRKLAAIDTEKRRLVQIVGGIEDEVLAPLPVSTDTAPAKGFGSPAAVQAAQEYTAAEHRQKIMDEAADALMGLVLTRTEAMRVVSAIADGEIAHITISY